MMRSLISGEADPDALADLAKGRLRASTCVIGWLSSEQQLSQGPADDARGPPGVLSPGTHEKVTRSGLCGPGTIF